MLGFLGLFGFLGFQEPDVLLVLRVLPEAPTKRKVFGLRRQKPNDCEPCPWFKKRASPQKLAGGDLLRGRGTLRALVSVAFATTR